MITSVSEESATLILRVRSALKMEAADTSGKLVTFHQSPRHHNQEDRNLSIHRRVNFKPQIFPSFLSTMDNGPYAERMLGLIVASEITTLSLVKLQYK
jgi:hypothetical protein